MNSFSRVGGDPAASLPTASDDPHSNDIVAGSNDITANGGGAEDADIDFDPLEESIALEMEKEFGQPVAEAAEEPGLPDLERSSRLLDMQRKRGLVSEMEEQIRQGAGLFGNLTKHIGVLAGYLEKAESDLRKLEKVEANANKLRVASEGICRKNQEMKAAIEEQKKRIALLEAKTAALRETNETARTNLARLLEEKRIATVDLASAQSEIARLENDRVSLTEKLDVIEAEVRELASDVDEGREREKAVVAESREKDEDIARLTEEIEELRAVKKQNAIDLEELKSRNSALESKAAEQKSRLDELMFEMESGRKEFEEIIRLKQQRILELETRGEERAQARHEVSENDTPSIAFDPAKERRKASTAKSSRGSKSESRTPAKVTSKG